MIAGPQAKYYVYAVVDKSTSPAAVLAVRLSRQDARIAMINLQEYDPSLVRVRRAKLTLFET